MNPAVFGIALWVLSGFMVAFAIAPRFNHSVSPTTNEDDMTDTNSNEYPHLIAYENLHIFETRTLDAFCSGYARALLWADAYHYVCGYCASGESSEHNCEIDPEHMSLERDEDAAYAYDTPGRWWEGMGIDFTDAVSFLSENMSTLMYLPRDDFENDWDFWHQHGMDFLLTRNHHGAGFWDRGYPEDISSILSENAEAYGEHSVLTDDSPRVTTL